MKRRSSMRLAAIAWFVVLVFGPTAASADRRPPPPPPTVVRLASPYFSLPTQVAISQGYFADENLDVQYSIFSGSKEGFRLLSTNQLDVMLSSADNAVNYRLNPHNALGALLDVQIIFGHDLGFDLSMVAQAPLTTIESLRGKALGVDAPDSGFALALYAIMRHHGMEAGVDYRVVSAGSTPNRLIAMRAGTIDATVLNSDSLVRARAEGYPTLAGIGEVADPFLGAVGMARESWLANNRDTAVRVTHAYIRAARWLKNPANRSAAIALIVAPDTTAAVAAQIYDLSVKRTGVARDAKLNLDGIVTTLEVRDEFGGFEIPQDLDFLASPESGIYDLSYHARALRHRHHGCGHD
jgi:ABC-type nitrate/sulfonate/bicarbonate transport system substrate-binding protein